MRYDKLVRDRIPEVIKAKGKTPSIHVADDVEYWQKLKEKLQEEVDEFKASESPEELADIIEVLHAIRRAKNLDWDELEQVRAHKWEERGGFEKKIILEES